MKKALFVCYGGGHADALIPVMQYLRGQTDIKVEAIGINLAADKLREAGVPCKTLSTYLDIRGLEIGYPLAKERHNFSSKVSFADSISYYGFTMSDLIDDVGKEQAYEILNIFDRRTMFPKNTMKRILALEKPDVVITTTMNRFEFAALYAAAEMGIPTVKVEDLIGRINKTYPDKIFVNTQKEKDDLLANGFKESQIILSSEIDGSVAADYSEYVYAKQCELRPTATAVFCDYAKKEVVKRGVPQDRIYITGQPAFDQHPKYLENTSREEVFKKLGLDARKKLVTFMSQPTADREDVFKTLIAAIQKANPSDTLFLIKLHPNEDGKIQQYLLAQHNMENVSLVKSIDVRELLAVSDLVITISSTTGLEAAVMGKPLVYINISEEKDEVPYQDMGIGKRTTDVETLSKELIVALEGANSSFDLDSFKTDGKAAQRVGELVTSLAKKEKKPEKNVVAIIQARMGSTRLPGKVLKEYCGKPQIQHVVDRIRNCKLVSKVIVATSDDNNNDVLKSYMTKHNIEWFSGSENNVLDRFVEASKKYRGDIIVRITADNPLTSDVCIDQMIESHIQLGADCTIMNNLPIGCTAEVVNADVLEELNERDDIESRDREHVTVYLYEHDRYKVNYMNAPDALNAPDICLTVDTPEDLKKMEKIYNTFYDGVYVDLEKVICSMKEI